MVSVYNIIERNKITIGWVEVRPVNSVTANRIFVSEYSTQIHSDIQTFRQIRSSRGRGENESTSNKL